ncbi:MAG TPA: DUF6666 family protein [Pirellulales bacterium]|nr:DUF6666 family protein [Pirellulales bacterium]
MARQTFRFGRLAAFPVLLLAATVHAQAPAPFDPYVDNRGNAPVVIIPDAPRQNAGPARPYSSPLGDPAYSRPNPPASRPGYYLRSAGEPANSSVPRRAAYQAPRDNDRYVKGDAAPPYDPDTRPARTPIPANQRYADAAAARPKNSGANASGAFRRFDLSADPGLRPVPHRANPNYQMALADESPRPQSVYREAPLRTAQRPSGAELLPPPPGVVAERPLQPMPSEDVIEEGAPMEDGGDGMMPGEEGYYADECNDDDTDYDPFAALRLLARWARNLTLDAGVEGFKGPMDGGTYGNFGFHEGVNWGVPLFPWWGVGAQIGFEAENSDFQGGPQGDAYREQYFFTGGLFHRPGPCGGLQWGVVFDMLRDDYYVKNDLSQIRGELSFCGAYQHELGAWVAVPLTTDREVVFNTFDLTMRPVSQYNFFYRHHFSDGGNFRLWGGFTDRADGIFGGDFRIPLSSHFAVESTFNYLIPREDSVLGSREAWNLGMSLVFYPNGRAQCGARSLYNPVFDVANNGTLISDVK